MELGRQSAKTARVDAHMYVFLLLFSFCFTIYFKLDLFFNLSFFKIFVFLYFGAQRAIDVIQYYELMRGDSITNARCWTRKTGFNLPAENRGLL